MRSYFIKSVSGTFGIRVINAGLSLIISIFLSRLLGAEGYGAYAYAIAWVMVLSIPAKCGSDEFLVREVAIYHNQSALGLLKGLLSWVNMVVFSTSVLIAILAVGVTWLLSNGEQTNIIVSTFFAALFLLPLQGFIGIHQATMRGFRRVISGLVPMMLLHPVLFIGGIAVVYFLWGAFITPLSVMCLNIGASVVVLIVGSVLLRRSIPKDVTHAQPEFKEKAWLHSILPFMLISGMYVINNRADVLMVGYLLGAKAAGIYTVAARCAELITFTIVALNTSLAPVVASLYRQNEQERLQRIVTKSSRFLLFVTLPIVGILVLFSEEFLLFWGIEFAEGATVLRLLSLGQLVNVSMGAFLGLLLNMTGHEQYTAFALGFAAIINIILNIILIPVWGINGAATATIISLVFFKILLFRGVYSKLNIHSTALGIIKLPR